MLFIKPLKPNVMMPGSTSFLPEAGIKIHKHELTSYWHRRECDKDISITEVEDVKTAPAEKTAAPEKQKKGVN